LSNFRYVFKQPINTSNHRVGGGFGPCPGTWNDGCYPGSCPLDYPQVICMDWGNASAAWVQTSDANTTGFEVSSDSCSTPQQAFYRPKFNQVRVTHGSKRLLTPFVPLVHSITLRSLSPLNLLLHALSGSLRARYLSTRSPLLSHPAIFFAPSPGVWPRHRSWQQRHAQLFSQVWRGVEHRACRDIRSDGAHKVGAVISRCCCWRQLHTL
jgi:hypothetical protein